MYFFFLCNSSPQALSQITREISPKDFRYLSSARQVSVSTLGHHSTSQKTPSSACALNTVPTSRSETLLSSKQVCGLLEGHVCEFAGGRRGRKEEEEKYSGWSLHRSVLDGERQKKECLWRRNWSEWTHLIPYRPESGKKKNLLKNQRQATI